MKELTAIDAGIGKMILDEPSKTIVIDGREYVRRDTLEIPILKAISVCESHEKQFVDFDGKTKILNHEFKFLYKDGRFVISKDGKVISDEELDWGDDLNQIFRLLMRNTDFDAGECGGIAEEVYYGGEYTWYV